ncbi:MAG: efflux RND transporter periplasmic adaptor subunit [Gammaproteobacteria bacterium]|nr:efflux RND transporter periplasmic adaptor subunit [Gammaproteobacteria bacterium]
MRTTYITAIIIAVLTALWLASGQLNNDTTVTRHPTLAQLNAQTAASIEDKAPTRVRARIIEAQPKTALVRLRGRTESKRTVEVRAETVGRIIDRPVERGTPVETGDRLCQISIEDRQARLSESFEAVNQARIEYQGSLRLQSRGFQSETAIATAKSRLASAHAQLKSSELNIERTFINAPFAGVVEQTHVEIGDYVQPGSPCATIVDLDPMLLVGQISERDVRRISVGGAASGVLADGQTVTGPISFISQQADPGTRTYTVEVQVANENHALRSGITTVISIPVETVNAHKVSPALFALDDAGGIGVRTLTDDNHVEFHPVTIIDDDVDGVWITGLPDVTRLITVGQELVVPGERVEVQNEAQAEMPALAPPPADKTKPGTALESTDTGTLASSA